MRGFTSNSSSSCECVWECVCSHRNAAGALSSWRLNDNIILLLGRIEGNSTALPDKLLQALCVCVCVVILLQQAGLLLFFNFLFCMPACRLLLIYPVNYSSFPSLAQRWSKALWFYLQIWGHFAPNTHTYAYITQSAIILHHLKLMDTISNYHINN